MQKTAMEHDGTVVLLNWVDPDVVVDVDDETTPDTDTPEKTTK